MSDPTEPPAQTQGALPRMDTPSHPVTHPEDGESTPRSEAVPSFDSTSASGESSDTQPSVTSQRGETTESAFFSPQPIRPFSAHLSTSVSAEGSPRASAHLSRLSLQIPSSYLDPERLQNSLADLSERPALQQSLSDASTATNSTVRPLDIGYAFADEDHEFPHFPNQAYSALQSQQHPIPYTPHFRARSSQQAYFPSGITGRGLSMDFDVPIPDAGSKTVGNTPASSPGLGLFTSRTPPPFDGGDDSQGYSSPYLHWTHRQVPKETEKAEVMREGATGRKHINQYEILDELGRGTHGKVKLARNVLTGEHVAIKIVERVSKKKRLGKDPSHEDKIKREVAILKKARHPNIVSLLEVIDDPASAKVYIVLEHVELGEVKWEIDALDEVAVIEYRRFQREKNGIILDEAAEEEDRVIFDKVRKRRLRKEKRTRAAMDRSFKLDGASRTFSLEYGGDSDENEENDSDFDPDNCSITSYATSSGQSDSHTVPLFAHEMIGPGNGPMATTILVRDTTQSINQNNSNDDDSGLSRSRSTLAPIQESPRLLAVDALEGTMYGAYDGEFVGQHKSTEKPTAPIKLARRIEDVWRPFRHVPLMTLKEARTAFRETVLGLEYLHYQGVIHRDIKPANLLQTKDHHIKISDFGVSYLGKETSSPGADQSESEHEHDDLVELVKTVGTPEFYAPELCNPDQIPDQVDAQIDVWALGVTLHCLIYGRLPYDHPDPFAVLIKIWEDEAYLLRRRLKAVDERVSSRPSSRSRYFSSNLNDRRAADDLLYDEVDDELHDLLRRLLTKDPKRRIKLLEIKHHPWVLKDLHDPKRWLDETDPARQTQGKKIEISKEDVADAVVPLTIVERARSALRKGLAGMTSMFGGKVVRRRAQSTATNDDATTASVASSTSSLSRESRRPSIKPEDMVSFLKASREPEHPLAYSLTASPESKELASAFSEMNGRAISPIPYPDLHDHAPVYPPRPVLTERAATTTSTNISSARTIRQRDVSRGNAGLASALQPGLPSTPLALDTPAANLNGIFGGAGRCMMRRVRSGERASSAHSRGWSLDPERSASASDDPRAEPSLGLSTTYAAGHVDQPELLREPSPPLLTSATTTYQTAPRAVPYPLQKPDFSRKSSLSSSASASRPQTATTRIDSSEFPSMETSPTSDDYEGYHADSDDDEDDDDSDVDEGIVITKKKLLPVRAL